jgi:sortase A
MLSLITYLIGRHNGMMKRPRRKKRHYWPIIVCTLLILIGLGLILTPHFYSQFVQRRYQAEVTVYKKHARVTSKHTQQLRAYNKALARGRVTALPLTQQEQSHIIAYVTIPRIKLRNQPVYYGADSTTLAHGVGVLPGTSLPIGGRSTLSVISGHSGFNNQIIFDHIKELRAGDRFYVTALGQPRHTYQVYKQLVVAPSGKKALAPIRIQKNKDIMVLLTCTPIFINSKRLLVFAKRVTAPSSSTTQQRGQQGAGYAKPYRYLLVGGVLIIIIIGGLIIVRRIRKTTGK